MRYMLASHRIFFYVMRKQVAEWYGFGEGSTLHPGSWDTFADKFLIPLGLLMKEETDWLRVRARPASHCHPPAHSHPSIALARVLGEGGSRG